MFEHAIIAMGYNAAPVNCAVNHCARSYSTWFCHMHHEQMEEYAYILI